ncbi:MAG: BamA/TamA family outer membrane protein [Thermoanaerobaculia bacterium]|nr:BamA/TamA family outer membrane protein [Thermoanaerobaculia bacterium]
MFRAQSLLRDRFALPILVGLLGVALLPTTAEAQFGKNKIQYRDFDWQIYHSPHFDVYFYEAERHLLQKVVSFAESAYDQLSRRFDYQIEEATPLIFYKTHSEFEQNNIILGLIPEQVGAFATNVRYRMVLPVDLPDAELHQLVLHELTHIFQYHILFGGKTGAGFINPAPTWLIEGMASYYAQDESTSDKMFLRDAVVNDLVPPITEARGGGFFAYRFGHAVFDFLEERWGPEGVLDFLYEYRASLGNQVDRALERAFRVEPEEFNTDFRRWLRERYLPQLVATGEPSYFGRRFYERESPRNQQFFSPVVSPAGDLVAALGTERGELDVILLDSRERKPLRNLTKGWSTETQYLTAQFVTARRRMGRDLSFSPDGNRIAVFGKREAGRSLVLVDVIDGGVERVIDLEVQQPLAPTFSADGTKVAFSGSLEGQFDIFSLDLETEEVERLTDTPRFDGGPHYSRDGRWLFFSSEVGTFANLFRRNLETGEIEQLTRGEQNDRDPYLSQDGDRLFFTSDRDGFDNVYSIDFEEGIRRQHTNAVTGCFMPTLLQRLDGSEGLIYSGFWKGRFDIYRGDVESVGDDVEIADDLSEAETVPMDRLERFEPDIQVAINEENEEDYGGFKLFLDDADAAVGVTSDQLVVSRSFLRFSDQLGDRRLFISLQSVESFSDFDILYIDLSDRLQWGGQVFDDRTFFIGFDRSTGTLRRGRAAFRQTGVRGFLTYPLDFYHRVEGSLAYIFREYDFQSFIRDPQTGEFIPLISPREDDYPQVSLAFVGDTTRFAPWGPVSGRRYRIEGSYAPDFDESGTLTSTASLDFRQYYSLTRRIQMAFRVFGGGAWGNVPNIFYFGGLDTVRGFDFRELRGDRAFFSNLELRFPLIEDLRFPFFRFPGIRGRIFVDVGGSWFDYAGQEFDFWDSENDRLEDAVSAYGWGVTVGMGGFDIHFDFAKRWNFEETLDDGFETTFWVGSRF